MMLGQLIQRVLRAQDLFLDQLGLSDIVLLSRINAAADAAGMTPQELVAQAIHGLLNSDDDGVWATLMGKLQGSDTPGLAFIEMAVRRHLDAPPPRPAAHPVPHHHGPARAASSASGCGGGGGCGCSG